MDTINLVTTLSFTGIGSSFKNSAGKSYFVSTVSRQGHYETIVKEAGLTNLPILRPQIGGDSVEAVMNHIALTRMCITDSPNEWKADALTGYLPNQLKEFQDSQMQAPPYGAPIQNEYNHNLLSMAGINYPPKRSPVGLIILVCIIAGIVYGLYELFT
jgi:hypothetical protein